MSKGAGRHIHIYGKAVDPDCIIAIVPYARPFDPRRELPDDINATLYLRKRPYRLHARRIVAVLAEQLDFPCAPGPHPVAINPAYTVAVADTNGRSELHLTRRGEKHRIVVAAPAETLRAALEGPARARVKSSQVASLPAPKPR